MMKLASMRGSFSLLRTGELGLDVRTNLVSGVPGSHLGQ